MYEDDNIMEEEEEDLDPTKIDPDDEDGILKEPDETETSGWEER